MRDLGYEAERIAQGHTARFHAKHQAVMVAAQAAENSGRDFGVWLDSLGFFVSGVGTVTRTDCKLVASTAVPA
jgi:hypothetical protein